MRVGRAGSLRWAIAGVCLGAASIFLAQDPLRGADYRPGTPFTYLFDTGSSSPAVLSGRALAAKAGWRLLPEDKLAHRFQGDAVLLNDKLTVVLRLKGPGAEVYSQTAAGLRYRAGLVPLPAGARSVTGLSAVKIIENNPGAVMLNARLQTAGGRRSSLRFRLTTGQQTLEVRPGEATDRLVVWCRTRYVVVPDFFGDDMVFGPDVFGNAAFDRTRFGLPTENFFLNLLDGGGAMLMCVWRDGRQGADALLFDDGRRRVIRGCEISCAKDKGLWIALMENTGIWQERTIPAGKATKDVAADWRLPFAARWRADCVRPDGVARSWELGNPGEIPPARQSAGPVIVYPIDRSRATPLTVSCPTDVLRNALGVGPCQYVLETEGLASEAGLTPDQAISWVEKQFQSNKQRASAGQIKQCLGQMTGHVGRAQARIGQYAALARRVQALCTAERQNGQASDAVETLRRSAQRLGEIITSGSDTEDPARQATKLAGEICGLIGRDDALGECQRLGAEVRRIGAVQDRTLSRCRMAVRWLRQQARMGAAADPRAAGLAKDVRARAEVLLRNE